MNKMQAERTGEAPAGHCAGETAGPDCAQPPPTASLTVDPEKAAMALGGLRKPIESPWSTMELLPSRSAPTSPELASTALSPPPCTASSGAHHALLLIEGRALAHGASALWEEGESFIGHLGIGEEWGEPVPPAAPRAIAVPDGYSPIVEVAAGDLHSLLLCHGGTLLSCGGGWEGALGHGDEGSCAVPRPLRGLGGLRVERVAAGGAHSLALCDGGALWSWGWGRHGQLGHGDATSQHAPCRVAAAASVRFVHIAAGAAHSLALADGRVYAFGRSHRGQCGHGGVGSELLPRCVAALAGVREVGASGDRSSAVCDEQRYSWGAGEGTAGGGDAWMPMMAAQ